jgi:hypothetical protein
MRVTLSPAGRATQTAPSPTAIPMLGSLVPTVIGRPRTLPGASVDPGHGPVPPVCDPDAAIRDRQVPPLGER